MLLKQAAGDEHFIAIGEVTKAAIAARDKDGNGVATSLRAAGKWALDVASDLVKAGGKQALGFLIKHLGM